MNPSVATNRRILVIDDNRAIHDDFRKILASKNTEAVDIAAQELFGDQTEGNSPCFEVDSALQGEEGYNIVKRSLDEKRPYAMAFVDGRMPPGWDGVETIRRIWEIYPDLQVVMCTAYSDYSWDDMIAQIGQTDRLVILKKPFDPVEAFQLANSLTSKWQLLQQVRSTIGHLENRVSENSAKLEESQEHLRLISENVEDFIAVIDVAGNFLYASPSFERRLGYRPDFTQGSCSLDIVHPEDRSVVKSAWNGAVLKGPCALEYRLRGANDTWLSVESHVSPVRNPQGLVKQLVVVARDISGRKRAEEERTQMEIQLRHAQKMESIGQLAAGIAHEINTPTQYIGDNTRFLKDAFGDLNGLVQKHMVFIQEMKSQSLALDSVKAIEAAAADADVEYLLNEVPKAIDQSLDGVERVAKIVRAMKEFSHPGSEVKSAIDLNNAIESTLTVCRNEWKYVADVETDFTPDLPLVTCLPGEMNQTILNIVVNASHAIADVVGDGANGKGKIFVSTRPDGEWVEIRIRDTGSGIPEAARSKVFDPFFTTKGVGKGTGQGLAIAHSVIVDKHAGTIAFETETGKGTTFVIRIPIAECQSEERAIA